MMDRCDQEARLKSTTRANRRKVFAASKTQEEDGATPAFLVMQADMQKRSAYSRRSKRKTTRACTLRVGMGALSSALFNY